MRKLIILAVMALLVAPVFAGTVTTAGNTDLEISGGLRIRWDYYNNVYDFMDEDHDSGAGTDDDFSYTPWRANVIVKALLTRNVDVVINLQGASYFGDGGFNTWGSDIWGPWFGTAAYSNICSSGSFWGWNGCGGGGRPEVDRSPLTLYESYIHVRNAWDSNWSFKMGRQEMPLGSELLVGNDEWYDGVAFDGIRADAEYDMVNLTLFWHKISKGFDTGAFTNEGDTDFQGVYSEWNISDAIGFDAYLLRLNVNTPDLGFGAGNFANWTLGVRAYTKENMGSIDWSAELVHQKNSWDAGMTDVDGSGLIFDGRIGWNFDDDMRLGFGLTYQSGDDDWTDTDADGFWRMFGFDSYGRWGNADVLYSSGIAWLTYDLGSVMGLSSGYIIPQLNFQMKQTDSITWGANLVYFLPAVTEYNDGSGEDYTIEWSILEIDAWVSYAYSEHLSVTANISHLSNSYEEGYASSGLMDYDLDSAYRAFVNFKATF